MRVIEPITRNEKYLAAAGGQEVTVPTPITRSEIYLAALSDENITPPTAITREEQFLTAAIDYIRNHSGGVSAFTLSYYDDSGVTLLYQEAVLSGGDGQGYSGSTPTKASTAQYDYTFAGWTKTQGSTTVDADALTGVTAGRNVYAVFTATTRSYTVTFMNVSTLMDTQTVTYGGTAVYGGATPTKAETSEYTYTFAGWNANSSASTADADALTNVTADRTVYAIFTAVSKGYTVYFYNGETLLETVTGVPSGGTATYTGATPTSSQAGYIFSGWSPSNTNITADTACYAQFALEGEIVDDWATISARSTAGTAQNYYSVGDCKQVHIEGTMGTESLNTDLYVYILGFNHNSTYEGNGITFGGFKATTDLTDIALVDNSYNSSSTNESKIFNISHYGNNNYGGWKGSDIRYDILGSTDVQPSGYGSAPTTSKVGYDATSTCATNPVSNTLMSCLPSDLRAVMKPMTKYTDNTGNSSNTSSTVTTSTDYLPLLAEFEVFGTRNYANETEKNKQAQYAYFVAGNSKIKYKQSNLSSTCNWWLRSPGYSGTNLFCYVLTNGSASSRTARISLGVAPAFLV